MLLLLLPMVWVQDRRARVQNRRMKWEREMGMGRGMVFFWAGVNGHTLAHTWAFTTS